VITQRTRGDKALEEAFSSTTIFPLRRIRPNGIAIGLIFAVFGDWLFLAAGKLSTPFPGDFAYVE
jgi:hypothetical protein